MKLKLDENLGTRAQKLFAADGRALLRPRD